ncbi:unnamed protein product [Cylicocyclus nassatus]|uniref:Peptidase C1A papain C-terminal domain-containing protein n=1 Tax=Cylicocyclus nassatus TaxID=53992 RepID=A0AA36GML1_CYLNA|nr:unnamed protein product [Cylicocyclus nassatus]
MCASHMHFIHAVDTQTRRTMASVLPKSMKHQYALINANEIVAKNYYTIAANEEAIKEELMTNGLVQSAFDTYVDFRPYSGGIYEHIAGARSGGHAIKIIGWGVEKEGQKRPYWIIANSWNIDWGEKGFFRMIRSKNNCKPEELAKAGMMDV